jgi:hypothetical protein
MAASRRLVESDLVLGRLSLAARLATRALERPVSGDHGGEEGERPGAGAAVFGVVDGERLAVGVGDRQLLVAQVVVSNFTGPPRGCGVAPYALDPANAARLWELSLEKLGSAEPRTRR